MLLSLKTAVVPQNRKHNRFEFTEPCVVERWGRDFHAIARNISKGGICLDIQGMGSMALDADLKIFLRNFAPITANSRWTHKRTFGLQFQTSIEDHPQLQALIQQLEKSK